MVFCFFFFNSFLSLYRTFPICIYRFVWSGFVSFCVCLCLSFRFFYISRSLSNVLVDGCPLLFCSTYFKEATDSQATPPTPYSIRLFYMYMLYTYLKKTKEKRNGSRAHLVRPGVKNSDSFLIILKVSDRSRLDVKRHHHHTNNNMQRQPKVFSPEWKDNWKSWFKTDKKLNWKSKKKTKRVTNVFVFVCLTNVKECIGHKIKSMYI